MEKQGQNADFVKFSNIGSEGLSEEPFRSVPGLPRSFPGGFLERPEAFQGCSGGALEAFQGSPDTPKASEACNLTEKDKF